MTFSNPRRFTIIVLVCQESNSTLYPSTGTVDGETKTSLATGDPSLCALGGARYTGKQTGSHPANVTIPVTP